MQLVNEFAVEAPLHAAGRGPRAGHHVSRDRQPGMKRIDHGLCHSRIGVPSTTAMRKRSKPGRACGALKSSAPNSP